MAVNFYTREKEIGGVKYVAQFSGMSTALKAVDNSYIEGSSNTSLEKMAEYLFKHIIVEPKGLTADDFESLADFREVVAFARGVMQGEFRDNPDESAAARKGGK